MNAYLNTNMTSLLNGAVSGALANIVSHAVGMPIAKGDGMADQAIKGATAGALVMLFAPTASMLTSKIMPAKKAAAVAVKK